MTENNILTTVRKGNVSQLKSIIKKTNINAVDRFGANALFYSDDDPEIVKLLIKNGINVNHKDLDGSTPLHDTTDPEVAKLLIKAGAKVNAKTVTGLTPLHQAETLDIAKMLVSEGADVNAKDIHKRTPLHGIENPKIIKFLIESGANVNLRDIEGLPMLGKHYSNEKLNLFIKAGFDLNSTDLLGRTELDRAWESDKIESFIDADASVDKTPQGIESALHTSVRFNYRKCVKKLLDKKANPNKREFEKGFTPLMLSQDVEITTFLLKAGADPNIRDHSQATALHYCYNKNLARPLIKAGAQVNAVDMMYETPLFDAVRFGTCDDIRYLLKNGASLDVINVNGKGVMDIAKELSRHEIISLLKERGAQKGKKIVKDKVAKFSKSDYAPDLYELAMISLAKSDSKAEDTFELFKKAAEAGHAEAANNLGEFYHSGYGCKRNNKSAIKYFEKAGKEKCADALLSLGYMYENGTGCEKDPKKGYNLYKKAADLGSSHGAYNAGLCCLEGVGVKKSPKKALDFFFQSAEGGFKSALFEIGKSFLAKKAEDRANFYFAVGANGGDADCQYMMGLKLSHENADLEEMENAISWFEKSAAQDHPEALYRLGRIFTDGGPVKKNKKAAKAWFKKAADLGHPKAKKLI